jgi:cell wall-associated NlpC family hydrolase
LSAAEFVAAARELKGTRWRHRGRKRWAVDCLGLIVLAGRRAGITAEDVTRYGREPWDDALRKGLRERFGEPVTDPRAGDIAVIRWRKDEPSHVAIIADHPDGGLSLIHSHNLHGVVEHALAPPFSQCIVEVYRPWRATSSQ